jgi:RNA polymerase sigma-70 factor (ECF subfamily)
MAVAGGDDGWDFDAFYRQHAPRVRRITARRLSDPDLADEAAQDAFMRLHRAADTLRRSPDPQPLVDHIAAVACVGVLRRHARRLVHVEPHDPGDLHETLGWPVADRVVDPEAAVLAGERRAVLRAALRTVGPQQADVLFSRLVDGEAYEEIAARTGSTTDALRASVMRTRRAVSERYAALARARDLWGLAAIRATARERLRRWLARRPASQGLYRAADLFARGGVELAAVIAVAVGVHAHATGSTLDAVRATVAAVNATAVPAGDPPQSARSPLLLAPGRNTGPGQPDQPEGPAAIPPARLTLSAEPHGDHWDVRPEAEAEAVDPTGGTGTSSHLPLQCAPPRGVPGDVCAVVPGLVEAAG